MTIAELAAQAEGLYPEAKEAVRLAIRMASGVADRKAHTPVPRLAVVGRMKTGKSTFINSLLAGEYAATHSDECTGHLVTYRYGTTERWFEERPGSGAGSVVVELTRDEVLAASDLTKTESTARRTPPPVRSFVADVPCPFLQGWSLVDTPGYDGPTARRWPGRFDVALNAALAGADACLFLHDNNERAADKGAIEAVRGQAVAVVPILCKSDNYTADQIMDMVPGLARTWERGGSEPKLFTVSAHWQAMSVVERRHAMTTGIRRYIGEPPVHEWDAMLQWLERSRLQAAVRRHGAVLRQTEAGIRQCAVADATYDCAQQAAYLLPRHLDWLRTRCQGPLGPAIFDQVQAAVQHSKPVSWPLLRRCGVVPSDVAPTSISAGGTLGQWLWTAHDEAARELARLVPEMDDQYTVELTREVASATASLRRTAADLLATVQERAVWLAWRAALRRDDFRYLDCFASLQHRWRVGPHLRPLDTDGSLRAIRRIAGGPSVAQARPRRRRTP